MNGWGWGKGRPWMVEGMEGWVGEGRPRMVGRMDDWAGSMGRPRGWMYGHEKA